MLPHNRGPWSQKTKDWAFYLIFAGVGLLVARLLLAYAAVMMFATVFVLVTWPVFARIRGWTGRPFLSAVVTMVTFGTVVVFPLAMLLMAFVRQGLGLAKKALAFVEEGGIETSLTDFQGWWGSHIPASLASFLPDPTTLTQTGPDTAQGAILTALQGLTAKLPTILASTAGLSIEAVIFLGAVATFYVKGEELTTIIRDVLPLEDEYVDTLYEVFRDLANHVVSGTLGTAAIQGVIATIGYAIAGVDGLVFFGALTALFAMVPLVGGAIIYMPLVLLTYVNKGVGWAVFLFLWHLLLTSQVDTILRPLFLRGQNEIPPLLIFVAVFGGIGWLGFPGALAGPVIVTAFVALYLIFRRDFLGKDDGITILRTPTRRSTRAANAELPPIRPTAH